MGDLVKSISQLIQTITSTLSSNAPPYIHCSKINGFSFFFKSIAPHLGTITKIRAYQWTQRNAIENINNVLREFMQTYNQCNFDNSSHFALTVPISTVHNSIVTWMKDLKHSFDQLGVTGIQKQFDDEMEEIEQREKVDLKRIAEIIVQIRDKNMSKRKDVKKHVFERSRSFERLGIILDTNCNDLVVIKELPESLNLVLQHEDLEFGKKIGTGISGFVYRGKIKTTGQTVAIKILHTRQLSPPDMERYRNEIFAMSTLIHPTLLEFCGYTQEPPYCIATKFMENGSLFNMLATKPDFLTPTDRTLIAYDVARGMEFLHSRAVIHRDLKSLNILIDENKRAKICDFGFVRMKSSVPMTGLIGTSYWMAPENLLSNPNYDEKVDVYSYGILLWELLTSKQPYAGMNQNDLLVKIIEENLRPTIPKGTPKKLKELIKRCWATNPELRPPFKDIVTYFLDPEYHFPGSGERIVLLREIGASSMHTKTSSITDYTRHPIANMRRATSRTVGYKKNEGMESVRRIIDAMKQGHIFTFKSALDRFRASFSDQNVDWSAILKLFEEAIKDAPKKFKGCLVQAFFDLQTCCGSQEAFRTEIVIALLKDKDPDIVSMTLTLLALSNKPYFLQDSIQESLLEFRKFGDQNIRVKALHALLSIGTPEKLLPKLNELLMFGLRRMPPKRLSALLRMACSIIKIMEKEDISQKIYTKLSAIAENAPYELLSVAHQCIYEFHKKEGTLPDNFIERVVDKYDEYKFIFEDFENDSPTPSELANVYLKASMTSKGAAIRFATIIANNENVRNEVVQRVPFGLPKENLSIVYEQIIPNLTKENTINNEEFYTAACKLLESKHYGKVCDFLGMNESSLQFAEKCGIYNQLMTLISEIDDKKMLSSYTSLMLSYLRRTERPLFSSSIPRLNEILKENDSIVAPNAFSCLTLLSKFNSPEIDIVELNKAASIYTELQT